MSEPECIFCRIAKKDIPAEVVYEDEQTCAFLDITPRAPGHMVVIPRVHTPNLVELPDAEILPLFRAVQKMAALLMKQLNPEGLTIGVNQGRASGQSVDHLHIHLLPRYLTDGGGSIHSVVNNPGKESIAEIAKKLRS